MTRASGRRAAAGIALLLVVLTAACGQKAGVGGSLAAGGALTDGTGAADGTTGIDTATDGTEEGGAEGDGQAGGTGRRAGGGATGAGGASGTGNGGPAGAGAGGATGPLDRTGISKTEIKIGIHAPESGAAAVSTFREAVGVYSEWAGQIKGLGNRRIVVAARDDKFDSAEARHVCRELVEVEKVFLLIGGAGVDAIKSCAEYAATKGVPYLSPGVTEGPFRGLSNYFALSETYNQQNVQVAQLIKNQIKKKNLGIVLTDSPELKETEASIKQEAARNGIKVVATKKLAKNAGKGQTDAVATDLEKAGADVVYALISPTVFAFLVASAQEQQYAPTWTGPGLSIGVNLVAAGICRPPFPDVRYMSPMVQLDVIDNHDANYRPAYREKNPGKQPDDIGILLWGIEKMVRQMMEADGADLSRQTFMQTLSAGKPFATNVYAPVKYGGVPHFGASTTTLLKLDCQALQFKTVKAFASSF